MYKILIKLYFVKKKKKFKKEKNKQEFQVFGRQPFKHEDNPTCVTRTLRRQSRSIMCHTIEPSITLPFFSPPAGPSYTGNGCTIFLRNDFKVNSWLVFFSRQNAQVNGSRRKRNEFFRRPKLTAIKVELNYFKTQATVQNNEKTFKSNRDFFFYIIKNVIILGTSAGCYQTMNSKRLE